MLISDKLGSKLFVPTKTKTIITEINDSITKVKCHRSPALVTVTRSFITEAN